MGPETYAGVHICMMPSWAKSCDFAQCKGMFLLPVPSRGVPGKHVLQECRCRSCCVSWKRSTGQFVPWTRPAVQQVLRSNAMRKEDSGQRIGVSYAVGGRGNARTCGQVLAACFRCRDAWLSDDGSGKHSAGRLLQHRSESEARQECGPTRTSGTLMTCWLVF